MDDIPIPGERDLAPVHQDLGVTQFAGRFLDLQPLVFWHHAKTGEANTDRPGHASGVRIYDLHHGFLVPNGVAGTRQFGDALLLTLALGDVYTADDD